ncbi:MAG: alpha/beta hydrolase [Burkholderiales bacterium]|nr:alpha/beta hydrolase [Burkholderiales bacterium]
MLLLHGITDSWRSFAPVLPLLPAHWHVVGLSQRGHGESDKPVGSNRTRDFAADAAAVARALDLPPLLVVGHSMGAANAFRLAIDHPHVVRGVVAAGAFAQFGDIADLREFVQSTVAPLMDPVPRELGSAFQQDTLARSVAPELFETVVDESLRVPAHVWRSAFAGLLEDDFCAELSRVKVPTLLVQGALDTFVPAADTAQLLRALPCGRASVWAEAGHAMHWEEPGRFAAELVRFAAELGA